MANYIKRVGTIVAIDPDIKKNGIAVIDRESRSMELYHLPFPETLELVRRLHEKRPKPFAVFVEAGWMNRGNWHITESRNGKFSPSAYAAAVGQGTGEGHAVSKLLLACFEYEEIPSRPIRPLRKCWKGPDRKITHDELMKELVTYHIKHSIKRTNPETRDAALLALVNL